MKYWTIKKQIILGLSILILINIVTSIFTAAGIYKLKSLIENISANQMRGEASDLMNYTSTLIDLSIVVMLSASTAIAYVIVRSLNRALTNVADSLGEGANQIAAASGQL